MDDIEKALREWCPEGQIQRLEALLRTSADRQRQVTYYKNVADINNRMAAGFERWKDAAEREIARITCQRDAAVKDNKDLRKKRRELYSMLRRGEDTAVRVTLEGYGSRWLRPGDTIRYEWQGREISVRIQE